MCWTSCSPHPCSKHKVVAEILFRGKRSRFQDLNTCVCCFEVLAPVAKCTQFFRKYQRLQYYLLFCNIIRLRGNICDNRFLACDVHCNFNIKIFGHKKVKYELNEKTSSVLSAPGAPHFTAITAHIAWFKYPHSPPPKPTDLTFKILLNKRGANPSENHKRTILPARGKMTPPPTARWSHPPASTFS